MVVKYINCLLNDGTTTRIDIDFYPIFKNYNWYCNNRGYIVTNDTSVITRRSIVLLHHLVLNFKYDGNIDLVADHKYGDKKDNRLKNTKNS